jgi:class 3 adenylate cyclase
VAEDFSTWSFLPSYNVHFFRRVKTVDDYLATAANINPTNGSVTPGVNGHSTRMSHEDTSALPDGVVTFLMTDVVESTQLWLQNRAQMYGAMRRHDQILSAAIAANQGVVLKERGEGDSFFAVFHRPTDALSAALDAQAAVMSEPWSDNIPMAIRVAILTGEADAQDRDYRSPAVNRCAKLRRRAVGNQILVSESTYSIVADILRGDMRLESVGKRRLEGHDRPEEVYVLQHGEVALAAGVAEDEV